jgi:hypothetical protein
VPSLEVGLDAALAIGIVALLAITRRHRIRGDAGPIAVSLATGAVLGFMAVMGLAFMISWVAGPM